MEQQDTEKYGYPKYDKYGNLRRSPREELQFRLGYNSGWTRGLFLGIVAANIVHGLILFTVRCSG